MKNEMIAGRETQEQLQFIDFETISEISCGSYHFVIIKKDNTVDFTWSVVTLLVGLSRHVIWLPYLLGFIDIHLRSGFCAKYRPSVFILVPQQVVMMP